MSPRPEAPADVIGNAVKAMRIAIGDEIDETVMCGGDVLWQGMCCEWAELVPKSEIQYILADI